MFHGIKSIRSFPEICARLLVFREARGYMVNFPAAQRTSEPRDLRVF